MAKTPKKQSKGWWQQQNYTNPKKTKSIENKSKQKFLSQECKCLFVISLYLKSKNANKTNDDENTLSQEDREWWKKKPKQTQTLIRNDRLKLWATEPKPTKVW